MADSTTVNRCASAQYQHEDSQGHKEQLNMDFLDFGGGDSELESSVFHGSPFFY